MALLVLMAWVMGVACNDVTGTAGGYACFRDPVDGVPDQVAAKLYSVGGWDGPPAVAVDADLMKPYLPEHAGQPAQDTQAGAGTLVARVPPPGESADLGAGLPVVEITDLRVVDTTPGRPTRTLIEQTRGAPAVLTAPGLGDQWDPTDKDHQEASSHPGPTPSRWTSS